MFGKILPTTIDFVKYFEEHCALIEQASKELASLSEPGANVGTIVVHIKELEHEADTLTHRCLTALLRTFITPFERSHIQALIRRLDDVMDSINDAACRISLYEIHEFLPEAIGLTKVIQDASVAMTTAVKSLRNLKDEKALRDTCIHIHRLENDGDEIMRAGLKGLFNRNLHPYLVIQWKEVFEHLERATDRCEDVADIVQSIVIEAS